MFPRLAAKPKRTPATSRAIARPPRPNAAAECEPLSARAQLRKRLLKMIVNNERTRRNEPHAS
jgi:hypothetical protein